MGQRHQLFVIARINGHYRTLCAIHHQWLYGHTALRRCLDVLKIFGDEANRMAIQQEFSAASGKDEGFWVATKEEYHKKNSNVPFPFIATCLIMGASFNEDGYHHSVIIESFYMQYDEGDNNNGITVFDITNLDKVRYCFVDFMGMESKREVDLMTPLSARTYLEAYYELNGAEEETSFIPLLQDFEQKILVTTAALKENWPEGDWQDPGVADGEVESLANPSDLSNLEDTSEDTAKSLRDRSMDTLLDALLDDPQDISQLVAEAESMTDFIPKLRLKLYANAAGLKLTSSILELLCRALQNETEVDLSPFKGLTVDDLSTLVKELRKGKMAVLNLSNMPHLTQPDLEKILGLDVTAPKDTEHGPQSSPAVDAADLTKTLQALLLLENPKIPLEFLAKHGGNCEIYHSEMFRRGICRAPWTMEESVHSSIEFPASGIVSQLVWVGIPEEHSYNPKYRQENGEIDWKTLQYFSKSARSMSSANNLGFKHWPLDVPISASKTSACLKRLLHYLSSKTTWYESWSPAAACCFACASASTHMTGYGIGPLSFALSYNDSGQDRDIRDPNLGPLVNDQWAIVLVHEAFDVKNQVSLDDASSRVGETGSPLEADPAEKTNIKPIKRLRYVLAKALAEDEPSQKSFLVTDVPGYLERVLGGKENKNAPSVNELSISWKNAISDLGGEIGYYEDDDIYEILEKVYSPNQAAVKEAPYTTTDAVDDLMARIFSFSRGGGETGF